MFKLSVSWNLPEGWLHSFFPYTQTLSLLSSSSSPLSLFFFLGNLRGVGWGGTRSRIQTIPIDCVVNLPNNWCILPSFFIDMWLSISKSWQALPILELGMEGGGAEARGFWIPEEYTLLKSLLWLGQLISSSLSEKLSSSLTRVPRCCRTRDLKSLYFFYLILFLFCFVWMGVVTACMPVYHICAVLTGGRRGSQTPRHYLPSSLLYPSVQLTNKLQIFLQ